MYVLSWSLAFFPHQNWPRRSGLGLTNKNQCQRRQVCHNWGYFKWHTIGVIPNKKFRNSTAEQQLWRIKQRGICPLLCSLALSLCSLPPGGGGCDRAKAEKYCLPGVRFQNLIPQGIQKAPAERMFGENVSRPPDYLPRGFKISQVYGGEGTWNEMKGRWWDQRGGWGWQRTCRIPWRLSAEEQGPSQQKATMRGSVQVSKHWVGLRDLVTRLLPKDLFVGVALIWASKSPFPCPAY